MRVWSAEPLRSLLFDRREIVGDGLITGQASMTVNGDQILAPDHAIAGDRRSRLRPLIGLPILAEIFLSGIDDRPIEQMTNAAVHILKHRRNRRAMELAA